jgi:hypothetical protein
MAKSNIDLEIIKRLVVELEASVKRAEDIKAAAGDKIEWIVELNKASGLAAGIMSEGALLAGDIQMTVQGGPPASSGKQDFMEKILGGLKGPGSAN